MYFYRSLLANSVLMESDTNRYAMKLTQETVGPYEIQEEVGRGGTSIVYRALDTRDEKEVALKILLPQFSADDNVMRRFVKL